MTSPNGQPSWEVTSADTLPLRHAICMTCGWSSEPWTGTREMAADHVRRTGHTVDWHHGTQETLRGLAVTPGQRPAPVDSWEEAPEPARPDGLEQFIGRAWPQLSFAEGIDQLARLGWTDDPGLLARADQAAAYVRERARAGDVRVGRRWIPRRSWRQLAVLAFTSAAVLAAGVAVLLGHVLALGSYPVAGP